MLDENIRNYRKSNNLSQDELAEKLNVTRQSISLWETGQTQPSLENIMLLAKIFNISTDELLKDNSVADEVPENISDENTEITSDKKKKIIIIAAAVTVAVALIILILLLVLGKSGGKNRDTLSTTDTSSLSDRDTLTKTDVTTDGLQSDETDENGDTETQPGESGNTSTVTPPSKTDTPSETKTTPESKKPNLSNMFSYFKNYIISNGTTNGDYTYISKSSDTYGGYASEDFNIYYWGDTDKVEFCLHSVLDDTFSINFYFYIPKTYTGSYEYVTSYYYRDTGISKYQAEGTINASEFTKSYPLRCTDYIGDSASQNNYMEMSREGMCDLLSCLKNFLKAENLDYSFEDLGFTKF